MISNISAKAMHALDWVIKEAAKNATIYEDGSQDRKEYCSRLHGARDAYEEIKQLRKAIAQGVVK